MPRAEHRSALGTIGVFVALWLLMDRSATFLGSYRGEIGITVMAVVVTGALVAEMALGRHGPAEAFRRLGLGPPARVAAIAGIALAVMLVTLFILIAGGLNFQIELMPGAATLALGIFAQGGLAEECVFRGFLFRRLRCGRSFWSAARLSALPFAAVHVLLFLTFDFPMALASLLLAISLSFPLAWLFDIARGSVWPGALLHAVIQAAVKIVVPGEGFTLLAICWMAVCALLPWLLVFVKPNRVSPTC